MKELNVVIAKYYLPDELFAGQVEEIQEMLIEHLSRRFSHNEAVNKASHFIGKYYLNMPEA